MKTSIEIILKKWELSLQRYQKIDNWSLNENISTLGLYLRMKDIDKSILSKIRRIRDYVVSSKYSSGELLKLIKLVLKELDAQNRELVYIKDSLFNQQKVVNGQKELFKGRTNKIFEEKLHFKNDMYLRNFDIELASKSEARKVRKIVEKRMSQAYYVLHHRDRNEFHKSNNYRYWEKRATSFQLYNIGQIENVNFVSRGGYTHWKKTYDLITGKTVFKKKKSYPNMEEAVEAINRWESIHPYDKRKMYAYKCSFCGNWHIGHTSDVNQYITGNDSIKPSINRQISTMLC